MTTYHGACAGLGAVLIILFVQAGLAADAPELPPAWAFPVNPPGHSADPEKPNAIEHVAGSSIAFTRAEIDNMYFRVDWFPREHPPMPAIVAVGSKHDAWACSACHQATGLGGPESAALAGLPESYIVEQVLEMRAGRRSVAQARMMAPQGMAIEARKVGAADLEAAARYFSQLPYRSRIRVVETDTVPKTSVQGVSVYARAPGGGTEPLGQRVVEMPEDLKQWDLGNPHARYVAYVPRGSIGRGESLVASGGGALPCRSCHGPELKGMGTAPGLAGRSPSYLARQLYDIQHDTRTGATVAPMLAEVAHMTPADRIAIVAYLASRPD